MLTLVCCKNQQYSLFRDYISESKFCLCILLRHPPGPPAIRRIEKLLNCETPRWVTLGWSRCGATKHQHCNFKYSKWHDHLYTRGARMIWNKWSFINRIMELHNRIIESYDLGVLSPSPLLTTKGTKNKTLFYKDISSLLLFLCISYTPASSKLKGGILVTRRPSVNKIVSALYLPQY